MLKFTKKQNFKNGLIEELPDIIYKANIQGMIWELKREVWSFIPMIVQKIRYNLVCGNIIKETNIIEGSWPVTRRGFELMIEQIIADIKPTEDREIKLLEHTLNIFGFENKDYKSPLDLWRDNPEKMPKNLEYTFQEISEWEELSKKEKEEFIIKKINN